MSTQRRDITRQAGVAAALAGTLTINALANILPLNGRTTGEISNQFPLKITPPGYVFAIWSLIYSALIGYAVYQALPSQRDNRRLRGIGWLFVISCACNAAWLVLWHYGRYRLTLAAMVGLLLSLILIDRRLDRDQPVGLAERLLVRTPFGIYLGWINVATLVNVTVVLYDLGWEGAPLTPNQWTAALALIGGGLASALGVARYEP
ncbi:MAG: tryptophan-rich sensory protein [Oscillochloris sp.]|nr:tryptophan-rich sensory protein [Oscillochloris sp.]